MIEGRSAKAAAGILLGLVLLLTSCGKTSTTPPPTPAPASLGPVGVFPGSVSVPVNQQAQFTAFLASAPTATFTWSISGGSANGSINSSTGVYTAPSTVPSPASVTITATDSASSGTTGTATITITVTQGLVVGAVNTSNPTGTPGATDVVLASGATQTFSAQSGGAHVSPTWEVNGTPGGSVEFGTISADLNGNGVFIAPLSPPTGGASIITAISAGNSGSAIATVVYSNASLNGPYAFSYTGNDASGPLAVAGSFTANGAAGTLSGVEDYNSASLKSPAQELSFTGTFSVSPDGSGTATVNNSATSNTETWALALTSASLGGVAQHVLLVRFDSKATGSGAIDEQTPIALAASSFVGNYAFVLAGFDSKALPLAVAGKFRADGIGSIPPGTAEEDYNDGGTNSSGAVDTTLSGSFFLDPNFPGSGRGLLTLTNTSAQISGTYNFTFYMVDGTHMKVVENDLNAFLAGDFYNSPNTNGSFSNASLNANFAFALGGDTATGSGPFAEGGVITANGAGTMGGEFDENNSGSTLLKQTISSAYTIDANFGRVDFSFTVSGKTSTFVGYPTSNGGMALLDVGTNEVASGFSLRQTSLSPIQGNYAMNFAGLRIGKKSFTEEDIVGQVQADASLDSVTGTMNIDDAGTVKSAVGIVVPASTTSTTPISSADASGRGTMTLTTASDTFTATYYLVTPDVALTLGTDPSRVSIGTFLKKF